MSNSTRHNTAEGVGPDEYQFVCPTCAQTIAVNGEMRRAIIANGCPVCTETVTEADFE